MKKKLNSYRYINNKNNNFPYKSPIQRYKKARQNSVININTNNNAMDTINRGEYLDKIINNCSLSCSNFNEPRCCNSLHNKTRNKIKKSLSTSSMDNIKKFFKMKYSDSDTFLLNDVINELRKNAIEEKVNIINEIQKNAIKRLSYYKMNHPTDVEKLQTINENCKHKTIDFNSKIDPRVKNVLKKYETKQNLISKNKNFYIVNNPRKAIDDYYKICISKPQFENHDYDYERHKMDQKHKDKILHDLENQIKCKEKRKRLEKKIEKENEIFMNKINNEFFELMKAKKIQDKKRKQKQFLDELKMLNDLKDLNKNKNNNKIKQFYNYTYNEFNGKENKHKNI